VHKTGVFSALQQLLLLLVAAFAFQLISTALIVTKNISASSVPIIIIVIINYHESVFLLSKFPPSASLFSSEFFDLVVSIIHHQFVVEIH
jgi:hypothetical protein